MSGPPEARLGGLFATDERWMAEALRLAREAGARGEVPVGALVVRDGVVLARGHNQVEALRDATAHAEILAIGAAGSARVAGAQAGDADEGDAEDSGAGGGDWRLLDATLYVTLEPCTMCCGAILLARVGRVVFGATDPRAGAVVSTARLLDGNPYRHRVEVVGGILAGPCGELLRGFFRDRRGGAEAG